MSVEVEKPATVERIDYSPMPSHSVTDTVSFTALERRAAAMFVSTCMSGLGFCLLLSSTFTALQEHVPTRIAISGPIIIVLTLSMHLLMRASQLPLAYYGITTWQWPLHVRQALKASAPVLMLLLLLKALLLYYSSDASLRLFQPDAAFRAFSWPLYAIAFVASLILNVAQEFCRCSFQYALQRFFTGHDRTGVWRAILITNLLFAALHAHMSMQWALIVFVPGLLWGWLCAQQGSFVGAAVSHALVSICAILVIGFPVRL